MPRAVRVRLITYLVGITFGDWWRLLRDNGFSIDARYLPRAALITVMSLWGSLWRQLENRRYTTKIERAPVESPVFVLGHWGSGTTHLHSLLAVDTRFAAPTLYEVANPHTFLTTESAALRVLGPIVAERRVWDNVAVHLGMPNEDEFALALTSRRSPYLAWSFPRREAFYDRYLSFDSVGKGEREAWQRALASLVRKLSFKHRRPLILKSPTHTARIRLLLEVFPEARFVHIRRHPRDVFHATRRLHERALPYFYLQRPAPGHLESGIVHRYTAMYDAFFRDRDLIPAGRFHELAYEDLERDPLREMARLYEALELPAFVEAEADLRRYVASLEGYRKNVNPPLPQALREQLHRSWRKTFESWGYDPP